MALRWVDESGLTRLEGEIATDAGATGDVLTQQADGTFAPAPGGGGSSPLSNTYYGATVGVANGASTPPLTVNYPSAQGAALLDLTTPAAPKLIAAGAYVLACTLSTIDAMTAGGHYSAVLAFPDSTLTDLTPQAQADVQVTASDPSPSATLTMPYLAAAGDTFTIGVTNADGVQSINFYVSCLTVVKIA